MIIVLLMLLPSEIFAQCNADFTFNSKVCAGSKVSFIAQDSGNNTKYYWDFGDPFSGAMNEDTTKKTAHFYKDSGIYIITLIVTDSICSDTQQYNLTVVGKPKADFSVTDHCSGLKAQFNNLSNIVSSDSIIKYHWDLGNSNTSNIPNPSFTYTSSGQTNVRLIILTSSGCTDTIERIITIFKKPSGFRSQTSVCKNEIVDFWGDTLYNATSYAWNFGDSNGFVLRSVSHVYKEAGTFFPTLTVHFGTATCTVGIDSVVVFPLPDADFTIIKDSFCFNFNNVCIKLNSPSALSKSRSVVFDDGFVYDAAPFSDSFICHQYVDSAGGTYSISVEIIDLNQCISTITKKNSVVILPELEASFTYQSRNGCFNTPIYLINKSNQSPPEIRSYQWDLGDGSFNDSIWSGLSHTYFKDGTFSPRLILENKEGCRDTFIAEDALSNTNFTVDAKLDSIKGICHNNNLTFFSQTPITGATIDWYFGSATIKNSFSPIHSYKTPGVFNPWVLISKNGCDSIVKLDSVIIHGPVAAIGSIINQFQCQSKDTVFFQNNSLLFRNSSPSVFWDAGDFNASNCVINSGKGQNVGQNCRYSEDAKSFKHLYTKGLDTCYYVKLIVKDTTIGCADSAYAAIPLMPPLAKGRFVPNIDNPCPGPEAHKSVSFNNNLPNPQCLKYAWWVMWDSLKARQNGNFDSYWSFNSPQYNYSYADYAGDSNGYVTIGLIVENGRDTNGNFCRDTAWFHHIVKVKRLNPLFGSTYNPTEHYCPGSAFLFFPLDSNQSAAKLFRWDFGDGTILSTSAQGYQKHTYRKSGSYKVILTVSDSAGCIVIDSSFIIDIGFKIDFDISARLKCTYDTFQLIELNRYYANGVSNYPHWSDSARKGKEKLKWDLGDGNGFQNIGPNPVVNIKTPGIYGISIAAEDSSGCLDTFFNNKSVQISGVYAGFTTPSDTILCAQTLKFNTTATVTDSSSGKSLNNDFVSEWEYNFGAQYPISSMQSPARYFATGNYSIRQIVTNNRGCKDTTVRKIAVIGPQAKFSIVSDTMGCSPLRIEFKNQSGNANSWTWYFRDISNSTFSTNGDTNVVFYYRGYGVFTPRLLARGSFTLNGITRVCNDIDPDTSLGMVKNVLVWEQPKPNFKYSTNCKTGNTSFTSVSKMNSSRIVSTRWDFGDGSGGNGTAVSHKFSDTGTYRIVLYVTSENGCIDILIKQIVISPQPVAQFGYSKNCQGISTAFNDSSIAYNDKIYRWRWNFGDGTTSNIQNPVKLFAKDTTYKVTLTITNVAGCSETVTKPVLVFSKPRPSFTFSNECDKNPIFFYNRSISKQPISEYHWYRGDGSNSTDTNDVRLFATHGSYNVKLKLKTVHGCMDSITQSVTVYPNPVSVIYTPQIEQCWKHNNFRFEDSTRIISGSTSAYWKLGDDTFSNGKLINHSFSNHGTFKVRLLSVSAFGCKDSAFTSVNIIPSPSPAFKINNTEQCLRYNRFIFSDCGKIAKGTYTLQWQFGDGSTSSSSPALHQYSDTGSYKVLQILTSDLGCRDTSFLQVRLNPMPMSDFTMNDSGQCLFQNNFVFTNKSKIGGSKTLTYRWNFGNGDTSLSANPAHGYGNYGFYNIFLCVQSSDGCRDTIMKTVDVHPMPAVSFAINDSAQCLFQNNFLFSNNSYIPYGTLSHLWKFGDGKSSFQNNPTNSYDSNGTFTNTLIVQSQNGCVDSLKNSIIVHPMPMVRPYLNNNSQCINQQKFEFTDSSTIVTGNLTRLWKFGDSTVSTAAVVYKNYTYPGIKSIRLIQVSDMGCADSAFLQAEVFHKPYPSVKVNDNDQCLSGNLFTFLSNSSVNNATLSHEWDFGDSTNSKAVSPSHTFTNHRAFFVKLRLTSDKTCQDSLIIPVTVYPMPIPEFIVNDSEQCLRQNLFQFGNQSKIAYGNLAYNWNFGDGQTDTIQNSTRIYQNTGNYLVNLVAISNYGCKDSVSHRIIVNPMPVVSFAVNDSSQCINNQNFIFTDNSSIATGNISRKWQFSDSAGYSDPLNRTFNSDTNHVIRLIQTSNRGCADTADRYITVQSAPVSYFTVNDSHQCVRQNRFVFANQSGIRKGQLTWKWNFGDGGSADSMNPEHHYSLYGYYRTTLTATSEKGCTDTFSQILRADPMPVPDFAINDTGQCINNNLFRFTNLSNIAEGSTSAAWKFGDQTSNAILNPQKTYNHDTIYSVWLLETSDKGCMDSIKKRVNVYPKPNSAFTINDTLQCLYQNNFEFINQSHIKYGSLIHKWETGDGLTYSIEDVKHVYATHGSYYIQLKSTSDLGCTDSLTQSAIVAAMPIPGFSINDPGQCLKNQNFVFTGSGSIVEGSFRTDWKTGDGDTYYSINATHLYSEIGRFIVTQILTSNHACVDSVQKNIWVNPNADVSFLTNDSDQCVNQQNFIFTNTSSIATGKIRNISWNLGNGQFSDQETANTYFPNSGHYRISLTTVSDSGCIDSAVSEVRVYPKPFSWFIVNDSAQCLFDNNYLFTDNSTDSFGVNLYRWNINSQSFQNTKTAAFKFATSGFKSITLISSSINGCSDTASRVVYVKPMPDPSFENLKSFYCELDGTYTFIPKTAGGLFSGFNISNNTYFPVRLWQDTVMYSVTINSCTDSSQQFTLVYPGPTANLPEDSTLCKREILELAVNSWQSKFVWDNGSTLHTRRIVKPGQYYVTVSNICGVRSDTINVHFRDINCRFYLPTAFTPNRDGLNDRYRPITYNVDEMTFIIYNRWGEKIYEGNISDPGWDGTYMGHDAQSGSYVIYVFYKYSNGDRLITETAEAVFELLR